MVTCERASNYTGYIIRGFAGIQASQLISVEVEVENPPIAANYTIQAFSYSTEYEAKIAEASAVIGIENICNSS